MEAEQLDWRITISEIPLLRFYHLVGYLGLESKDNLLATACFRGRMKDSFLSILNSFSFRMVIFLPPRWHFPHLQPPH